MGSATATAGTQNKTAMGYPAEDIPPQMVSSAEEPSSPPVYLHQVFLERSPSSHSFLLHREQIMFYRLSVVTLLLLVSISCIFLSTLLLRPRLPELQVASITVSPLSSVEEDDSATCNLSILVSNPNHKLTAFYDDFRITIGYQSDDRLLFSDVHVPAFAQPAKSDTFLQINLQINNADVVKDAVMALKEDLGLESARFDVKILALIRLESKEWSSRSQMVLFYCPDVMLGFPEIDESGDLVDHFTECEVAL